jgi:hypothetical protein
MTASNVDTAQSTRVGGDEGSDASLAHLRARLEVLEARVAHAVAARRARRPIGEGLAGVFLSDGDVDALLAAGHRPGPIEAGRALLDRVEDAVDAAERDGTPTRLRRLARQFGLHPLDVELLIVALAPDLDARFEPLYAYLHDDLTRRRPSIGLGLELTGADPMDAFARGRLSCSGPLVSFGLISVDEAERPFLSRTVRVPDRVTAHLLGDDTVDAAVEPYLVATVPMASEVSTRVVDALRWGSRLFYARESPGASGSSMFGHALLALGLGTFELDLGLVAPADLGRIVPALLREVGLTGAGLIVDHADGSARGDPATLRRLTEAPAVTCLVGAKAWDPEWARVMPFLVDVPVPPQASRAALWQAALGIDGAVGVTDDVAVLSQQRMRPLQIAHVVDIARRWAASEQRSVTVKDLEAGARQMNSVALDALSTRITPSATWDSLVLKPDLVRAIQSVRARALHRELVQSAWGFGRGSRRRGTIALFSGPPGTGKTLAAEVVAGDLGVDLYVVNLATVVDKYIGETEKNLERVFHAAEEVNGLLFFDEADALFGKRSEVKDARDRYANIEVAYLLQRLERFDGVAVLATNLSANFDEAFARRLDVTAEFKLPEVAERRAIWARSLPPSVPLADDVDLDFLASSFELSGGSIRNVCVTAAYHAADDGGVVAMQHLVTATALEHRKLGRLIVESEFRQHFGAAMTGLAW